MSSNVSGATSAWARGPRRSRAWMASVLAGASLVAAPVVGANVGSASTRHSGQVVVLYCGSFLDLMQQKIAPAFHRATGYTISGISAGSNALATEIKGKTVVGDVFISAAPSADVALEGSANGAWVSSFDEFAESPLVLGYNPASRFAQALRTTPWYDVVGRSGFRLGRTDPSVDPKGVLAVDALRLAARKFRRPALDTLTHTSSNVYDETALVGELQSGQLDAGFFYDVEAAAAHLKTVPLSGTALAGDYTVAVLRAAPHEAAARSFLSFLLSGAGRRILEANGVDSLRPMKVVRAPSTVK